MQLRDIIVSYSQDRFLASPRRRPAIKNEFNCCVSWIISDAQMVEIMIRRGQIEASLEYGWQRVSFRNFSRENYVENKTCFSRKYQCGSRRSCVSREKGKMRWYIVKLASLAVCESCNLRDLQISKIIIHSEKLVWDPKFSQDTCKTPESKLVMILGSLAAKFLFARLAVSLWNLSARLTRSVLLQYFFLRNT